MKEEIKEFDGVRYKRYQGEYSRDFAIVDWYKEEHPNSNRFNKINNRDRVLDLEQKYQIGLKNEKS